MNLLAKNQTNVLVTLIIIIGFVIFFRVLRKNENKENFQDASDNDLDQNDFLNDDSLLALQDFTKFAVQGPKGDQGDRGDEGRQGDRGEKGVVGKTGDDYMSTITANGKLWLGGSNSGKSGYNKNNEVQFYLGGTHSQGANGGRQGETTYKLKIDGYDNTNSDVYPIHSSDKNGNTDFFVKNRTTIYNKAKMYLDGTLNLTKDIILERNSFIKANHLFSLYSKESINLYARDAIHIKKMNNQSNPSSGNLTIDGLMSVGTITTDKTHLTINKPTHINNIKFGINYQSGVGNIINTQGNNGGIMMGNNVLLRNDNNQLGIYIKEGTTWHSVCSMSHNNIRFNKNVSIQGNTTITGNTTTTGNTNIGGNSTVTGSSTLGTLIGNTIVTGNLRTNGTLHAEGNCNFRNNVNVHNNVIARGNGEFGPAFIGNYGGSISQGGEWAQFSHRGRKGVNDYACLQHNLGETLVNCSNGKQVEIRRNNNPGIGVLKVSMLRPVRDTPWDSGWFARHHRDNGGGEGDIVLLRRHGDRMAGFVTRLTGKRCGFDFIWGDHHGGSGHNNWGFN